MPKSLSILRWTAKTSLSSRIQDPLGLYMLKFLEKYFLPGITTQTERLRYYSFLTWAWKIITDRNLKRTKILDMEKVVTLAAALHHLNDSSPPRGIRNRQSAKTFLQTHRSIRINQFTNFGRNNRIGYGNYYYRGPLATLRICGRENDKIVISEIGERIVKAFEDVVPNKTDLLLKNHLSRKELSKLSVLCFCADRISSAERKLWRIVFFGFTKPSKGFSLYFDHEEFIKFGQGKMKFYDISIDGKLNIEDYLRDLEKLDVFYYNLQEFVKTALARRYTLFMIMKIINETKPIVSGEALNQIIRDCIYFNQFDEGGNVKVIDFGPLRRFIKLWESYVHNLYYINFFEFLFEILLKKLANYPMGTTIQKVISSFDTEEVVKGLQNIGVYVLDRDPEIKEIDSYIRERLSKKTSLDIKPNEKQVFLNVIQRKTFEKELANLIVLFLLLKYRFENFSQMQRKACEFHESRLYSLRPSSVYHSLPKGNMTEFLYTALNLVKNRHRLISALKYTIDGTRSWLFTEEDGLLYYYGKEYWARPYREAKWRNVIELLIDMGLVTVKKNRFYLSRLGEKWLEKIF